MTEQIPAPKAQGLGSIMMNAFSSPNDAFEGLRESESKASYWLVPLILLIVLASVSTVIMFSNDTLKGQILESRELAMQKQVDSGKMTQEQADRAKSQMDNMGGMFIAFGVIGSVIFLSIMFFGAALALWLVDKFALKSTAGYGKHLEMYGISSWVGILGGIVTLLMIVGLNSMYASPSAALAVYATFDPLNTTHKILAAINIFSIWQAIVVGFGISKFGNKSAATGIGIALGLWILWVVAEVFLLGLGR
jgi:hypothetical protein